MAIGIANLDSLKGTVLAGHDFDKTIALTSEPLEGGYTVEQAYVVAVERVLGPIALQHYRETGGLRNRAPSEVVDQLAPDYDTITRRQRIENLVEAKLDCLTPQIGRRLSDGCIWPPLNDGFREYWHEITSEPGVSTGIASSGHEEFIRKTFEVHDETPPDVFVTDDDMRLAMEVLPRMLCEKPSRLLIDTMAHRWLDFIGTVDTGGLSIEELETVVINHVVYAGDDPDKDGRMATNARVTFIHVPIGEARPAFERMREIVLGKVSLGGVHV